MILKNLKIFAARHTMIFVFFILAQIVTLSGVFVTYNYLEQEISTQKSYYEGMRTYTVQLSGSENIDENISEVLRSNDNIQRIYTVTVDGDFIFCGDYYGKSVKKFNVTLGTYLSDDDIVKGEKKIVIPLSMSKDFSIGDMYLFNNEKYEITGVSIDDNFYIPYNSLNDKSLISGVCVVLNDELSSSQSDEFMNRLSGIFKNSVIMPPSEEYGDEMNSFRLVMVIIILLLSLGIFNLSYLYSFILEKRKKQYSVLQICGCTKLRGILIYAGEVIIVSVASYILSALLFKFALLPLIMNIDSLTVEAMGISSYLFLFVCYIIIMMCIFLPCVIKYSSKTVVQQYKN
ncbi:MAG: hypothetical protein PUG48_07760 [Clostridia bacterium]|nr:hypothetical protein [Clostridia bacterium]